MAKKQYKKTKTVKVEVCEQCNGSHEFPVDIVFDEEVNAMGLMGVEKKNETHDVVLICPDTLKNIVVPIPVSLGIMQTFVRLQPK